MDEKVFQSLVKALQSASPASDPSKLALSVAPQVRDLSDDDISELLGAILPMYSAKGFSEADTPAFIRDLAKAIASGKPPLTMDIEVLKARFAVLLAIPSIAVSAKAFLIQREQQNIFLSARSLSDIRPVFSEDGDRPMAFVVSHQLKVSYFDDGQRKTLYLALDDDDISELQKVLTRARTKSKVLSTLIQQMNLPEISNR